MNIKVAIRLSADETLTDSPDTIAGNVIAALGGDPAKDYCAVATVPIDTGSAGTPPPEPPPPPTEPSAEAA